MKHFYLKLSLFLLLLIVGISGGYAQTTPTVTDSLGTNVSAVTYVTATTATIYGTVTNAGDTSSITAGICYGTSANPTTANNAVVEATGYSVTSFSEGLTGLTPNTTYYARAYATNRIGTGYGSQLTFTTLKDSLPIVVTDSVVQDTLTGTSAQIVATLLSDGADPGFTEGLCYSTTSTSPTLADSHVQSFTYGNGKPGSYSYNLTGLTPHTKYYVTAYATNAKGTSYGTTSVLTFTTDVVVKPSVSTDSIPPAEITTTSADLYTTITSDGKDPGVTGGLCYGTSPNPTTANGVVNVSYSPLQVGGAPYYPVSGLTPNTTYYVRAYATNVAGTSYGNSLTFTTLPLVAVAATNFTVCTGGSTTLTATGASSYVWSPSTGLTLTNNGATAALSPVSNVTYTVTGTYANGFMDITTAKVTVVAVTNFTTSVLTTNDSAISVCNGYLEAVANGVSPYTYHWNDSASVNSPYRFHQCVGTYSLTVVDSRNCLASAVATVGVNSVSVSPNSPSIVVHSQDVTSLSLCNGAANIRISGGKSPYSISFAGKNVSSSNYTVNNLCSGFYTVNVTDANSKSASFTFVIGSPLTTYNSIPPSFLADSVFNDTLIADAINNCVIFNGTVDSLAIQNFTLLGSNGINVVWGVYQKGTPTIIPITQGYQYTAPGLCRVEVDIFCTSRSSSSVRGIGDVVIPRADGIETVNQPAITVYPNPFSSTFTVSGISGNADVKVFNSLGVVVYSEKGVSANAQINLQGYSSGVYLLQVITNNGIASRNIIKY